MNNKNLERLAQLERALKDGCSVSDEVQILKRLIENETDIYDAWHQVEDCVYNRDILTIRELLTYIENYE